MSSATFRIATLVAILGTAQQLAVAGPTCPSDVNDDDLVDVNDILGVVAAWGATNGPADVDQSGLVDVADLLLVISNWGPCTGPSVPTASQLAGLSLASYPFFDYALAFNAGMTVQLAVDPFLHPDLANVTADAYIVADRTALQWESDQSLVDVRPAGPQSITFAGADLPSNTFTIDSGTLSGVAGTGVGAGYDIVIDANRNAILDAGDVIDGADGPGIAVVHDLTLSGPLAVTSATYTGGTFLGQRTYYPTDIASMGQLPLVVVSHGNGHQYTWYDYLLSHLASYGYVAMSHQNNTSPGVEAASTTTINNTNYLLGNLGTIAGGVLNGHVDPDTIIWIGHSRGGEGVVRAYDRLFDGTVNPTNFGLQDIVLVSSIAPTDFLGTASANPHAVPYHLIYGSSDGDVCGCPDNDIADSFNVFERSIGPRVSTYIHGADHNDFNCCGVNDFQGPANSAIGGPEARDVAKAVYLALIKYTLEGNLAAKDFLWRQWETLHPIGVNATTIVVNDLRNPTGAAEDLIIDDFQTQSSTTISSSGGAVAFDVLSLSEGVCHDNNTSFTWLVSDVMNGMVRGRIGDTGRCIVFNYNAPETPAFLEFEVLPALADWSSKACLSFRAAQGTRHPETIALLGDSTFVVTLRDGSGAASTINIGAYSGGIEEPYPRTGYGTGAGWQNEYEVIRIRLHDFLANGSPLDLANIVAVRFEFGGAASTPRGRLMLDDLMVTAD
ncbi:MAG: hypothetical protein L0219_01070 [Phycisphaerales bacterium]|nr:hypothetical protein [Phycisphaerales bacterium]